MGLAMRDVRRCYRQQQTLQELAEFGSVTANRRLRKYDWFRSFFGDYTHGTIQSLDLVATQPINRWPDLRALEDVEGMRLELANVPENVDQLAELRKLKYLDVKLTTIGASDPQRLTVLTEIPQLWHLWLDGDDFDDTAILHISRDTRLESLAIGSSRITERSVIRLSELKSLTHLTLNESVVQNQDCSALSRLPNLSYLAFIGNNLSSQDEQSVRKLWPDTKIEVGTTGDTGEKFISMRRE